MRALAAALACSVAGCAHAPAAGEEADRLPVLALPAVGPEGWEPAQAEGKVVLLSFLTTWCFPCLSDLPTLEGLQRAHGEAGLQVVAVGVDREGRKVLEPFAYAYKLPFPVLVADERLRNGQSRFGPVQAVPQGMLFGRDGRLASAWRGPLSAEVLETEVRRVLQR
ncbi:MAG: TlpA family protein disulfide reductase [Deltaproteobacteria bacterium]|nr:TlpA family protein disulfide reductase [Deltaproteobacteria bacterium]